MGNYWCGRGTSLPPDARFESPWRTIENCFFVSDLDWVHETNSMISHCFDYVQPTSFLFFWHHWSYSYSYSDFYLRTQGTRLPGGHILLFGSLQSDWAHAFVEKVILYNW